MEYEAQRLDEDDMPDIERSGELIDSEENYEKQSHDNPVKKLTNVALKETVVLPAPEGWLRVNQLADTLNTSYSVIKKLVDHYAEDNPEFVESYRSAGKDGRVGKAALHVSPELVKIVKKERGEYPDRPRGWLNKYELQEQVSRPYQTIGPVAEKYRSENPEWFKKCRVKGFVSEYYAPELISILENELEVLELPPEGWKMISQICKETTRSYDYISKLIEPLRMENPEWFRMYKSHRRSSSEYFSPELLEVIYRQVGTEETAPNGWLYRRQIEARTKKSYDWLKTAIEPYRKKNPEWFKEYIMLAGEKKEVRRLAEHYSPELVRIVEELAEATQVPEGWQSLRDVIRNSSVSKKTIIDELESDRITNPDWFKNVIHHNASHEYLHPGLVKKIEDKFGSFTIVPEDWLSNRRVARDLRRDQRIVATFADQFRIDHPDWFLNQEHTNGMMATYYAPELVEIAYQELGVYSSVAGENHEQVMIENKLKLILAEKREEAKDSTSEFSSLIKIFGSEVVLDILYQQHPEYKKLPVPYVKSMIGEYLGDFMMLKSEFSLEVLEKAAAFLETPGFKDRLMEVVKTDCLRMLNHLGRMSLDDVNAAAVSDYLDEVRQKSLHIDSPELEEILGKVKAYYTHLFNDIHKPDHFIDQFGDNRLFPDINQRINVQELLFKHKILIADEMGTGKSASAIMAKEIIGAKQALVVVPSNVMSVWENYLSDKTDGDKQLGYFKEGQAPNVLIVNSLEDLTDSDTSSYDYVVISQERLNDTYTDALESLEYDMMIVDEMHKLKNITSGKRSNNLIRLAERIDGDSKYLALLSGTPVPNKIGDVALTLKLLYPEDFAGVDNTQLVSQILSGDVLDLRSRLVMRTQMKSLAENIDMPEMMQETEKIELSDYERDIYDILLEEDELTAPEKLALLRQFTLNPRMLDATPDVVGAKVEHVGGTLRESFKDKNKIVMFVNGYIEGVIRGENTIIPDLQLPENVEVRSIHGQVSKQERLEIQRELQTRDKKMLLLVSGQTADTGVDFSDADEVFHYNEPWSLYDKQQQTARVYRPGLENDLTVRTFVTEATLEEGINRYIEKKYNAIEKLLRGIPISDIERNMLSQSEKTADPNAEVSPELAKYYFSSQDKMARIYGYVKEIGEDKFLEFLSKYGQDYADSYADLTGARSYQANMARLSGNVIKNMIDEQQKNPHEVRILDLASGPEILKRHVVDELAGSVYSLDINHRHFTEPGKKVVGSISKLPVADGAVDYVNLSLGLHYTRWAPSRGIFERLETLTEVNRVLSVGGRATIGLIHSLKLNDNNELRDTLGKLGFKVIDEYTANVSNGKSFDTQLLTLEKTANIIDDTATLASTIDSKSLKFSKNDAGLIETRKIATQFDLNGTMLSTQMNALDQKVLEEERATVSQMEALQKSYGGIEKIPEDKVVSQGFSRVFNGRRYVLFRRLDTDPSAVLIR